MRKILFPFELDNPIYREAYIHGIKFARKINAEMILLNVFQVEVGNDITEEKYNRLKRDNWFKAYNEISRFNRYYLVDHANVETDLQIRKTSPGKRGWTSLYCPCLRSKISTGGR